MIGQMSEIWGTFETAKHANAAIGNNELETTGGCSKNQHSGFRSLRVFINITFHFTKRASQLRSDSLGEPCSDCGMLRGNTELVP
jgi:hypothetical protein